MQWLCFQPLVRLFFTWNCYLLSECWRGSSDRLSLLYYLYFRLCFIILQAKHVHSNTQMYNIRRNGELLLKGTVLRYVLSFACSNGAGVKTIFTSHRPLGWTIVIGLYFRGPLVYLRLGTQWYCASMLCTLHACANNSPISSQLRPLSPRTDNYRHMAINLLWTVDFPRRNWEK